MLSLPVMTDDLGKCIFGGVSPHNLRQSDEDRAAGKPPVQQTNEDNVPLWDFSVIFQQPDELRDERTDYEEWNIRIPLPFDPRGDFKFADEIEFDNLMVRSDTMLDRTTGRQTRWLSFRADGIINIDGEKRKAAKGNQPKPAPKPQN